MNKAIVYLAPVLGGFVLAMLLFGTSAREHDIVRDRYIVRARIDTVHDVVRVPIHPLTLRAPASRRVTDGDRHCAELDTIVTFDTAAIAPDTLHIAYCEPPDRFEVALRLSARRIPIAIPVLMHDTLIEHAAINSEATSRPWYVELLMILGAAAAGYIFGK